MNIIEAIKSGRLCRPKGLDVDWLAYSPPQGCGESRIPIEWVLMEWEIQEPTVTITRAQFWEAVEQIKVEEERWWLPTSGGAASTVLEILARKLGLEP